ncbi:50S ribosomal protein L4 [Patescibacteria group bacterium]|nr:50S ribosomal protein L4 [Patescibacteria group bacterium]
MGSRKGVPKMKKKTKTTTAKKVSKKEQSLSAPLYGQKGEKLGRVKLNPNIFGNKINEELMKQAVRIYLTNQRKGTASTKTRGEVSGGGAKPWKQKGLGKARTGSIRDPHWKGGGVIHGPKPRKFELSFPKKMKRKSLLSALSDKAKEENLVVIKELKFKEPKTKMAADLMLKLPIKGKSLFVLDSNDQNAQKSFRNLPNVGLENLHNLNTFLVVNISNLIVTKAALDKMDREYLGDMKNADK